MNGQPEGVQLAKPRCGEARIPWEEGEEESEHLAGRGQ